MTYEHDPIDLHAQARTAAESAEEERLAREKEKSDLCWVMGNKQGRRFIHRQLSDAGVWLSSFNVDNAVMAFNEGRRNVGLKLLSEIMEACPEKYNLMLTEQKEAREKDEHRNADRRTKRHD